MIVMIVFELQQKRESYIYLQLFLNQPWRKSLELYCNKILKYPTIVK